MLVPERPTILEICRIAEPVCLHFLLHHKIFSRNFQKQAIKDKQLIKELKSAVGSMRNAQHADELNNLLKDVTALNVDTEDYASCVSFGRKLIRVINRMERP